MTRRGSARIDGYATLAAVALVAALALRRPELAIVGAPFALLLAIGTRFTREPQLDAALVLSTTRTLEKDPVDAELTVASRTGIGRLELFFDLPAGVEVVEGHDAIAVSLGAGDERVVPLALRCSRWGVYDVGNVKLWAGDVFRLVVWEQRLTAPLVLKAYPRPEPVGRVLSAVGYVPPPAGGAVATVEVIPDSISWCRPRRLGDVHVALRAWQYLGLDCLLQRLVGGVRSRIPMARVLHIWRRWRPLLTGPGEHRINITGRRAYEDFGAFHVSVGYSDGDGTGNSLGHKGFGPGRGHRPRMQLFRIGSHDAGEHRRGWPHLRRMDGSGRIHPNKVC